MGIVRHENTPTEDIRVRRPVGLYEDRAVSETRLASANGLSETLSRLCHLIVDGIPCRDAIVSLGLATVDNADSASRHLLARPDIQSTVQSLQYERTSGELLPHARACLASIMSDSTAPPGARIAAAKLSFEVSGMLTRHATPSTMARGLQDKTDRVEPFDREQLSTALKETQSYIGKLERIVDSTTIDSTIVQDSDLTASQVIDI